jgi:hypothetical protein
MRIVPQKVCYELKMAMFNQHRMNDQGEVLPVGNELSTDPEHESEPFWAYIHLWNSCPESVRTQIGGMSARLIYSAEESAKTDIYTANLDADQIAILSNEKFVREINRERILQLDSEDDVLAKLADGNEAAQAIFARIEAEAGLIDPINIMGAVHNIRDFDYVRLYGAEIVRYHEQFAEGDLAKTMAVGRACQCGLTNYKEVHANLSPAFATELLNRVQKQMPRYGAIEANRQAKQEAEERDARLERELDELFANHPVLICGSVYLLPDSDDDKEGVDTVILKHEDDAVAVVIGDELKSYGLAKCSELGVTNLSFIAISAELMKKYFAVERKKALDETFNAFEDVVAASALEATRAERSGVDGELITKAFCASLQHGMAVVSEEGQEHNDPTQAGAAGAQAAQTAFQASLSMQQTKES